MRQFFQELFEYSHHYNQRLADIFLNSADRTSEKAIQLYSHILNAQHIWNSRIESKQAVFGVWDLQPVQDFKEIDQSNHVQSVGILKKVDLDTVISYSRRGESFSNTVRDILFHVVNHCTYHRGQIATEFRQAGLEPLISDYIFFKR